MPFWSDSSPEKDMLVDSAATWVGGRVTVGMRVCNTVMF